jgi:predicted ATPase/DNA-binding SARP family transcriptional activator
MLEVRFLGQFEVLWGGKRLAIPTRNAQSLFAYLVLNEGIAHRREKLAGLLWPDSSEGNARSNLRHELWRMRKTLEIVEETLFLIDDLTITFQPRCEFSFDIKVLEAIYVEDSTASDLIRSLSVYQGELLPGFYEECFFSERNRLHALFEAKMARLLEILQAEGRWTETLDWGMRWIAQGYWPEPAYRALMSAYANTGDTSKAVATYERLTLGLQKDLGVKPSEQTRALYKRLKAGWRADSHEDVPIRKTQAQKNLSEITPPAYPLPRVRRSNLPKPLTSFIGREKEIQQVEQLVAKARLVTITGSGGVGKTRLAIQVAEALTPHFKDGTFWVELASLFKSTSSKKLVQPDGLIPAHKAGAQNLPIIKDQLLETDLIAQAVAKALRVPETPGVPLLDGIIETLHDKQLLLVLDNCEHLIEECADLVERVLSDCPEVVILTTSREALKVSGEKAWLLPSLTLPGHTLSTNLSEIFRSEAVSLFIERSADALPGYKPGESDAVIIAQICQQLGGIPLAIELAAARINLLSAEEIANRLDQRFSLLTGGRRTSLPRHQTLRAAIEWSHDLLNEPEQVLFRRMSVFAGSFTLEAAESVCASQELKRDEVLALLGRLVDKSLLNVESSLRIPGLSTRYRFLDTIHSFGRLKLDEAQETECMRDRHALYYVHLVETAEPELILQNQAYWHRLLQVEHDNLRATIKWGTECEQAESALLLVGALLWFWFRSGFNREARDLAIQALALPSAIQFPEARARALNTAGFMHCLLGDTTAARKLLEEARSILKTTHNEVNLAWTMQFLGLVYAYEKEYEMADTAFKEGLAITRRFSNVKTNSFLYFYGDVVFLKGNIPRAKQIYEDSASLLRVIGNKVFLAYPLRRLGYLALEQHDIKNACKYFFESLSINHEVRDLPGLTASLLSFALLAFHLKNYLAAARLFGAVEGMLESLSVNLLHMDQTELGRIRSQLPACLDKASFTVAFTEGWEMNEEQAIALAEQIITGDG